MYGRGNNPDVNIDDLKVEWEGFKFLMRDTYCQSSTKAVLKMLVADRTIYYLYPQLPKMAAVLLSVKGPFSTTNQVKTDLCNGLNKQNLYYLMRIHPGRVQFLTRLQHHGAIKDKEELVSVSHNNMTF